MSDKTVGSQRKELESTAEIPQLKTNIGADGKERPRQVERKPVSVFNPTAREAKSLQNPEVVERIALYRTTKPRARAESVKATNYPTADNVP